MAASPTQITEDDFPDDWTPSTVLEEHITLLDRTTGRSLLAVPSIAYEHGWRVRGLGGYGPETPLLADGVTLTVAVRVLQVEAEAVNIDQPSTYSPDDVHDYKTCDNCGRQFTREPALEVACPSCPAKVGCWCERPSGHSGPLVDLHKKRLEWAIASGTVHACPDGPTGDMDVVRDRCEQAFDENPDGEPEPAQSGQANLGRWT